MSESSSPTQSEHEEQAGGEERVQPGELTFVEHLEELRKRLFIVVLTVVIGTGVCYAFIDEIVGVLELPAGELDFIYISPPELFVTYVRVAVIAGLVVASPVVLFQLWRFVEPALEKRERRYLLFALLMGIVFFVVGAAFAYTTVLPIAIDFFAVRLASEGILPTFSIAYYIGFVTSTLLAFGIVFQLPLFVLLLASLGLVTPAFLRKYRKIVVLAIVLLSAFLTPPDVISQLLLAGPIMLLYEFSVLITVVITRKKLKAAQ